MKAFLVAMLALGFLASCSAPTNGSGRPQPSPTPVKNGGANETEQTDTDAEPLPESSPKTVDPHAKCTVVRVKIPGFMNEPVDLHMYMSTSLRDSETWYSVLSHPTAISTQLGKLSIAGGIKGTKGSADDVSIIKELNLAEGQDVNFGGDSNEFKSKIYLAKQELKFEDGVLRGSFSPWTTLRYAGRSLVVSNGFQYRLLANRKPDFKVALSQDTIYSEGDIRILLEKDSPIHFEDGHLKRARLKGPTKSERLSGVWDLEPGDHEFAGGVPLNLSLKSSIAFRGSDGRSYKWKSIKFMSTTHVGEGELETPAVVSLHGFNVEVTSLTFRGSSIQFAKLSRPQTVPFTFQMKESGETETVSIELAGAVGSGTDADGSAIIKYNGALPWRNGEARYKTTRWKKTEMAGDAEKAGYCHVYFTKSCGGFGTPDDCPLVIGGYSKYYREESNYLRISSSCGSDPEALIGKSGWYWPYLEM